MNKQFILKLYPLQLQYTLKECDVRVIVHRVKLSCNKNKLDALISQFHSWNETVGFKPMISAGKRLQTYALDRVATGTAKLLHLVGFIIGGGTQKKENAGLLSY
jgi:hypothetical protein